MVQLLQHKLAADNSTDVATTAFVQQENNAQDLDFIGDTGTSSVLLNSQTLDFEGTANQIATAVTAQKVKFSSTINDVTIGGTFTGTTFAGDLLRYGKHSYYRCNSISW